jgi:hypothetical protein
MKKIYSKVFLSIVVIESLIFMMPTTLMLALGIVVSILGFFQGNKGGVTPVYLYIFAFLVVLSFAVYSLWWVIFSYRKLTLGTIPKYIWLGLLIGSIFAVLASSPFNIEPVHYISSAEILRNKLLFGLGPLITAITLLFIIYCQKKL